MEQNSEIPYLKNLCIDNGITQEFSDPRNPQQNGVFERNNRTLIEAARTTLTGC